MPITDLWLVYRVCKGRRSDFDRLYQRHSQRVYNLLRRLCGDGTVAEDLTQETFVAAFESLSRWKGTSAFSTWLCGIAVNRYRLRCRAAVGEPREEALDETLPALPDSDPFARYSNLESLRALEATIETLPQSCREAFVLVYIEGFAYREAAEALAVPVGTVQSRLNRAKQLLHKRLTAVDSSTRPDISPVPAFAKGENLNVL